ncbi:hypothetical protein LSCM1_00783 [Leishmania martiniquensis]|uniref:Uncharacterized protein n=1 Tax=Leishmania martiniquensis TaxID=1580590 RepID=A0A836GYJ2_9TRYP|nr:hypothetical protein LSCM1_00783 [Leishmania martiniquensis]
MSTSTRRISVTSEQLQSDALRAQLFSACCAYGVVEWAQYEEDPNYNTTTMHIQFQKLSSADRLRSDVQQRGRSWQIESEPAVLCVGADVLLSAAEVLHLDRLTAVLPSFACAALPSLSLSNASTAAAAVSASPTFEEKSFLLHGRSTTSHTTLASSKVTAQQEAALWSAFEQESSAVRHSCLGPYCAVLHFGSPRDANVFLCQHQLTLAEQHSMYAIHVGTAPGCALAVALPKMLTRHALPHCAIEGRVVRGYVVAMPSNTYCVVDAGLYPAADQASTTTLVHTHTNFLSVSLGDEVQVQLTSSGGLTLAEEGMVGGKLLRVTSTSVFSTCRSGAKAQLLGTAARTPRTSNVARGRGGAASTSSHQPEAKPGSGGRAMDVMGVARRATLNSKRSSAADGGRHGASTVSKPVGGAVAKALASKIFKSVQQRKGSSGDGNDRSAERICAYPAGLGAYARLLVRIERIEDDGLHARCAADADNCGYTGPVFIPAAFVPAGASSTGQGWRTFAVVGERMHVALLYMVAVGGSAATMRGVASKREADLRRTAVAAAAEAVGATPRDSEGSLLIAGETMTAVAMLKLSVGDLGVPAAEHTSRYFPAFLLRPALHASASLRQMVLLLPLSDMGSLDPTTLSTSPASLVVSEVINDTMRGQYAVVVPCAVYAARQSQRAVAQEQRKTAEVDEVKRRLAAVMGADILKVLNSEIGPAMKRPRAED